MPDTLTPDDLAALRERHAPTTGTVGPDDLGMYCRYCGKDWPCDAARLLAALDAAACRVPTKDGRELVVTAAELYVAWYGARAIAERAQAWAAAWKAVATRRRKDHEDLVARAARAGLASAEAAAADRGGLEEG